MKYKMFDRKKQIRAQRWIEKTGFKPGDKFQFRPWSFTFDADDWQNSSDILAMSVQEENTYFHLLIAQWQSPCCTLPLDIIELAKYPRINIEAATSPNVCKKFTKIRRKSGRFYNERMWFLRINSEITSINNRNLV